LVLGGIPGAWDAAQEGLAQARAGEAVTLDELRCVARGLDRLIADRGLPADARIGRCGSSKLPSRRPRAHRPLAPVRSILGPWSWMLLVYAIDEGDDAVYVVTVGDGRSSSAALWR
jgi:hypothetical protein